LRVRVDISFKLLRVDSGPVDRSVEVAVEDALRVLGQGLLQSCSVGAGDGCPSGTDFEAVEAAESEAYLRVGIRGHRHHD